MPILTVPLSQGRALVAVQVDVRPSLRASALAAGLALPPPVSGTAMIDTGADRTCADPRVIRALNLSAVSQVSVVHVHGQPAGQVADVFYVSLTIFDPAQGPAGGLYLPYLAVVEAAVEHLGQPVLIGNDVLDLCEFYRDGPGGEFALEW